MKWRILFAASILSGTVYCQSGNTEFGMGYTFAAPLATMQQNIRNGHGITFDYYVVSPNSRFSFGIDLNHTIYGHDKSRQEYEFDNGSVAPMDIIVKNSFTNLMIGSRYYLKDNKPVIPYLSLRTGYSFFRTRLNIYDPDDTDHCEPVDTDLLMKDGTFIVSAGGGLSWDLKGIFKQYPARTFLFNLGAALTLGGKVNYMNTDAPNNHGNPHTPGDVTARFINNQTQVVHEHHVGYRYTSFVEMIELRAGIVMNLTYPRTMQ